MKLGVSYPHPLIDIDSGALKHWVQGLEQLGYDYVSVGDHVVGAETSSRPDWKPYFGKKPLYDHREFRREPLVLFAFLGALTKRLEFATGILILPQRQAALVAKQTAEVDVLTNGRLRLVLGSGWNDVEYQALGMTYEDRGPRLDEQIAVVNQLWTQEVVTFKGRFHDIDHAGLNPMPIQRPIPLWFGGGTKPVLRRAGSVGAGWNPWYPWLDKVQLMKDLESVRAHARKAGRDPMKLGLQGMTYGDGRFEPPPGASPRPDTIDEAVRQALYWKSIGATHFTAPAVDGGKSVDAHLEALRKFKAALPK